jgi:hypothetical protein
MSQGKLNTDWIFDIKELALCDNGWNSVISFLYMILLHLDTEIFMNEMMPGNCMQYN